MRNLIILLLLAGGVGYGATKYYLHSEVEDAMDTAVLMMSPYADVQYRGVSSTVTGELTIEDIRVQIKGFADELRIDRVGIDTPSFLSLLDLGDLAELQRSGMPKSIGILVEGVHMPANADFYERLYLASLEMRGVDGSGDAAAQCTGKYGFSPAALRELGYNEQVYSLRLTARNEKSRYSIDVVSSSAGMWDVAGTVNLAGDITSDVMKGAAFSPRLRDMHIEFTDRSLNERVRKYCGELGLSDEDTIQAQLDTLNYFGASNGIEFDDYVIAPYREFLAGKSTLVVTAKPNEPLDLSQIDLYKPSDVPALLNLEATAR